MNLSNRIKRTIISTLVLVVSAALALGDVVASGQSSQQSSSAGASGQESQTGAQPSKRRSSARRKTGAAQAEQPQTPDTTASPSSGATMPQDSSAASGAAQKSARSARVSGEPADLSGTYTGTINYPGGNLTGDATLTINGNEFTLTSGSTTKTGRISAVKTGGYTAVAMTFGDLAAKPGQTTTPPQTVSLRARKTGDRLQLTSVPGETQKFSFVTGGTTARRRRGRTTGDTQAGTPPSSTQRSDAAEGQRVGESGVNTTGQTQDQSPKLGEPAPPQKGRRRRGQRSQTTQPTTPTETTQPASPTQPGKPNTPRR